MKKIIHLPDVYPTQPRFYPDPLRLSQNVPRCLITTTVRIRHEQTRYHYDPPRNHQDPARSAYDWTRLTAIMARITKNNHDYTATFHDLSTTALRSPTNSLILGRTHECPRMFWTVQNIRADLPISYEQLRLLKNTQEYPRLLPMVPRVY